MSGWILRTVGSPSCELAPRKRKQAGPTLLWHAKCCKRGTPPKMRTTSFWLLTKNFSKCQCSQWIHDFGKGSHILRRPVLRSFHPKVPHKFEQRARPISTSKWRMRHLTRWRCSRQVPKEQTKVWIDFGKKNSRRWLVYIHYTYIIRNWSWYCTYRLIG